jgi:hypothetical protein
VINVSEILNDPDLSSPFTALRSPGSLQAGRFVVSDATTVELYGSVQVADANTLQQVPEGDRVTGARVFWSTSPMYETRIGENPGLSDFLIHRGVQYRVAKVWDWSANGYYKALGVRIKGA